MISTARLEDALRSGLYATFSITTPRTVQNITESPTARTGDIPPLVTAVSITYAPTMINVTMGKIKHFGDTIHHRISKCDDRIDAAQAYSIF